MAFACKFGCGRETNYPNGVCVICKMDRKQEYETMVMTIGDKKREASDMAKVTKEKICIDCGNEYTPTSNVQKRCTDCGVKHKAEKDKKKGNPSQPPNPLRPPYQGDRKGGDNTVLAAKGTEGTVKLPKNWGKVAGKPFEACVGVSNIGVYVVSVDFRNFPELHNRLLDMAKEEIRQPADQLLYLLRNTFKEMEELTV